MMKIKQIFIFILLILLSNPGIAQTNDTLLIYFDKDWNKTYEKEKAAFYRKAVIVNNNNWYVEDYYISNNIQMTGTLKSLEQEIKNGHFVYYHENGQKSSEGNFVNDKYDGQWKIWYASGKLKSVENYKNGFPEGNFQGWYENGQMELDVVYKNGLMASMKRYFENGHLTLSGNYINGAENGEWKFGNVDGRIYYICYFKNGVPHGQCTRFFPEGQMNAIYKNGVLEGPSYGGIVRN